MATIENNRPKVYVCECEIPCDADCTHALNLAIACMLETSDVSPDTITSGIMREYSDGKVRKINGRVCYDVRIISRAGHYSRKDGFETHGKDKRGERMILASGSRDDEHGSYGESGATLVSDLLATNAGLRADAARELLAIVREHVSETDIATLFAYAEAYANASGCAQTGADRKRAHDARARIRAQIESLPHALKIEAREHMVTLGFTRETTRPDCAHVGDGNGRTMREGRSLANIGRANVSRAGMK